MIRFDNRDVGLSTKFDGVEVDLGAVLAAAADERTVDAAVPYTLTDMADDGFGLLDDLGIEKAHIVGASMGGMIVQTMAIDHPERVLTMTSIMSTTGEPEYGQPTRRPWGCCSRRRPPSREAYIEHSVAAAEGVRQPGATSTPTGLATGRPRPTTAASTPRAPPASWPASWRRATAPTDCASSTMPTLVIHGDADTLVTPTGGQRTAELDPRRQAADARRTWATTCPSLCWPLIVDTIASHARRRATAVGVGR